MPPLHHRIRTALALAFTLGAACAAHAQTYPERPVTLVVPFSAGGGVDAVGRLLAEKLRDTLGQSVVVENKGGASGMLGANYVARAKPDGYTLLLGSAGETAINAFVQGPAMLYDPRKDLAPVTLVARVPNVLVVGPSVKATNLAELVAYGKANPGKLTYASSGVGNPQHLNGELLSKLGGVSMVHVPYKGASGQLADVASGSVDMTFVSYAGAAPFIQGQRVRPLAVTSAGRTSFAPDIPAVAETPGLADYRLENWFGLFVPAGTPEPVIARLHEAVSAALQDPALSTRLREQGGEPSPLSPAEFARFIDQESVQYKAIVEQAGITAQ